MERLILFFNFSTHMEKQVKIPLLVNRKEDFPLSNYQAKLPQPFDYMKHIFYIFYYDFLFEISIESVFSKIHHSKLILSRLKYIYQIFFYYVRRLSRSDLSFLPKLNRKRNRNFF